MPPEPTHSEGAARPPQSMVTNKENAPHAFVITCLNKTGGYEHLWPFHRERNPITPIIQPIDAIKPSQPVVERWSASATASILSVVLVRPRLVESEVWGCHVSHLIFHFVNGLVTETGWRHHVGRSPWYCSRHNAHIGYWCPSHRLLHSR